MKGELVVDDERWMQVALDLAKKAEALGEVPVGAVLIKDNQLIAQGFNQSIASHDASAHAEIMAIRAAGQVLSNYRLVNCTLYVTLEPCAMCAMAMVHARIKRLVYAATEPRIGADGSLYQLLAHCGHNHQIEVAGGVLEAPSRDLLQAFFRKRRR